MCSQLRFYAYCFFAGLKELWSFRPKLFRPGRESTALYKTVWQRCFLLSLDSIAAIAKKSSSDLNELIDLVNHIRDTETDCT